MQDISNRCGRPGHSPQVLRRPTDRAHLGEAQRCSRAAGNLPVAAPARLWALSPVLSDHGPPFAGAERPRGVGWRGLEEGQMGLQEARWRPARVDGARPWCRSCRVLVARPRAPAHSAWSSAPHSSRPTTFQGARWGLGIDLSAPFSPPHPSALWAPDLGRLGPTVTVCLTVGQEEGGDMVPCRHGSSCPWHGGPRRPWRRASWGHRTGSSQEHAPLRLLRHLPFYTSLGSSVKW